MNKYAIQSKNFDGSVIATYFNDQLLELSFAECSMHLEQLQAFVTRLPVYNKQLPAFIKQFGLTLIDTEWKILFADWWNLYDMKRNKDEAERLFYRLPEEERVLLWFGTKTYNQYCRRNAEWYNKMYPDTFISKRQYKSEWDKIR